MYSHGIVSRVIRVLITIININNSICDLSRLARGVRSGSATPNIEMIGKSAEKKTNKVAKKTKKYER